MQLPASSWRCSNMLYTMLTFCLSPRSTPLCSCGHAWQAAHSCITAVQGTKQQACREAIKQRQVLVVLFCRPLDFSHL